MQTNNIYNCLIGTMILFTTTIVANTLTINVEHITQFNGTLYTALVTSKKNYTQVLNNKKSTLNLGNIIVKAVSTPVKNKSTQTLTLQTIPTNNYSILIFQDLNNNQYLDQWIFGPKEPFGFSQNPTINYRSPTFKETLITITSNKTITIKLNH